MFSFFTPSPQSCLRGIPWLSTSWAPQVQPVWSWYWTPTWTQTGKGLDDPLHPGLAKKKRLETGWKLSKVLSPRRDILGCTTIFFKLINMWITKDSLLCKGITNIYVGANKDPIPYGFIIMARITISASGSLLYGSSFVYGQKALPSLCGLIWICFSSFKPLQTLYI